MYYQKTRILPLTDSLKYKKSPSLSGGAMKISGATGKF